MRLVHNSISTCRPLQMVLQKTWGPRGPKQAPPAPLPVSPLVTASASRRLSHRPTVSPTAMEANQNTPRWRRQEERQRQCRWQHCGGVSTKTLDHRGMRAAVDNK